MSSDRLSFAIIPTHDRPEAYAACRAAISPQVDEVITICDGPAAWGYATGVRLHARGELNISRWWNLGLEHAEMRAGGQAYDVAVLNDDAVVPAHWFNHLGHMHLYGAAAACVDQYQRLDAPLLHTTPAPVDLHERLTGYAFLLDGTKGIRANEEMRWWFSDDAIDWTARTLGGTLIVPGQRVEHPAGGGTSLVGELAAYAVEDRAKFIEEWGAAPW